MDIKKKIQELLETATLLNEKREEILSYVNDVGNTYEKEIMSYHLDDLLESLLYREISVEKALENFEMASRDNKIYFSK